MREHWIPSYISPRYVVSQLGRVYDYRRDRILIQTSDRAGYLRVKLWVLGERKTVSVHRLIAGSFFDVDIEDWEVNHIDGDKQNNAIWNLELTDRSGNMLHAFQLGLARPTFEPFGVRIVETGEEFESTGQADRYLGVSPGSVSKTLRGLQPTCRGYTFERIERR